MFSNTRRIISRSIGPIVRSTGSAITKYTTAPARPDRKPMKSPSAGVIGSGCPCCSTYAAAAPPLSTQRQQQMLPAANSGNAERTPMTRAPTSTGCGLIVVLTAKMRDQLFALEIPQRVLQLHQLNEQIVFGVQTRRVNRRLEVKRQPLLDAAHVRAPGQIEEQRDVEHNRRGKNAVAAQEVDLQLHRVPEPAEDVDVVPAFLPRRLCSTSR